MCPYSILVREDSKQIDSDSWEVSIDGNTGEVTFARTPTAGSTTRVVRLGHLVGYRIDGRVENCTLTVNHPSGQTLVLRTYADRKPSIRDLGGFKFYVFQRPQEESPTAIFAVDCVASINFENPDIR
jgi:hypothetical protein